MTKTDLRDPNDDAPSLDWTAERVSAWLQARGINHSRLSVQDMSGNAKRAYVKFVCDVLAYPGGLEVLAAGCSLDAYREAEDDWKRYCEANGIEEWLPEPDFVVELPEDPPSGPTAN